MSKMDITTEGRQQAMDKALRMMGKGGRRRNFHILCPFHQERTESCYVKVDLGTFKCYGCGKWGDGYDLLKHLGVDPDQDLRLNSIKFEW